MTENQNLTALIERAIAGKFLLEVDYDPGKRIVEPHAYGLSAKGDELLRVYQVRGETNSDEPYGWRLMRLDKIGSLRLMDETFEGPREGYSKGDKKMAGGIIKEL